MVKMRAFLTGVAFIAASAAPGLAQSAVVISPEQQTVVREYVVEHSVEPVTLPDTVTLEVGAVLPPEVELHTFENVPEVSEYSYVVVDGQTVIVEPGTRRVVQIIE